LSPQVLLRSFFVGFTSCLKRKEGQKSLQVLSGPQHTTMASYNQTLTNETKNLTTTTEPNSGFKQKKTNTFFSPQYIGTSIEAVKKGKGKEERKKA